MNLGATIHRLRDTNNGFKSAPFRDHEIFSAFQPIYKVIPGEEIELFAVEALARPHHSGQSISPFHFFNTLDPKLLFPADWNCLIVHLANAAHLDLGKVKLFVNLNPEYASNTVLTRIALNRYAKIARKLGMSTENIVCEITEQRAADDEILQNIANIIRGSGGGVAVDDFGEELSDIRRVAALKPDFVKFSRSWVVNMMAEPETRAFARTTIRRIREMGAALLFEGVETQTELDWAMECGVTYIQGYFLGKPKLTNELISLDMLRHPSPLVPPSQNVA